MDNLYGKCARTLGGVPASAAHRPGIIFLCANFLNSNHPWRCAEPSMSTAMSLEERLRKLRDSPKLQNQQQVFRCPAHAHPPEHLLMPRRMPSCWPPSKIH